MLHNIKVKQEHLFLTAYTLWLIDALFSITMWNDIAFLHSMGNYMQKLAYLLLIIQFLSKKTYTKRDAAGLFMIVGTGVIAYHSVYNDTFMTAMIFIYFAAEVDFKKILKQTVLVQGIFMLVTVLAAAFGIIENTLWDVGNGRLRYALGYRYCSYSAHILLFITLAWVGMRGKLTIAANAILLGANTALYVLTDSKTDYFLCLLALAGYGAIYLMDRWNKKTVFRFLDFAAKYGCGIVTVFSVLLHALYNADSPVWIRLNGWLNYRLQLGHDAIYQYGFSLFGKAVRWYGMGSLKKDSTLIYNYVDCAYLKLLIEAGIILVLVMIIGFYFVGRRLSETRQYYLIWSLLVAFAYGIVNVHVTLVSFGGLILVLSLLFKKTEEDEETTLAGAFGMWLYSLSDRLRRSLCVIIILAILIIVTCVQIQGYDYIIEYDAMYRYIVGLLILLLAACTWERRKETYEEDILPATLKCSKTWFYYALWIFVIAAMISDFFVKREFGYAAFSMLLFGGIFYGAWRSMEKPERLVLDFRMAYKIYFAGSVLICAVTRPIIAGKCYNGLFSEPSAQAVAMLVAYALCIGGVLDKRWGGVNAIGSAVAFYLLYRSGQPIVLFLATALTVLYLFRKIYLVLKVRQGMRLLWLPIGFFVGFLIVWCLNYILTNKTLEFGFNIVYANEQLEKFRFDDAGLFASEPWTKLSEGMISNYEKHIKKLNFMGHKHRKQIKKVFVFSPSSIIGNAYRYGIVAGIAYVGLLLAFLKQVIQRYFREHGMEMAILGMVMIVCCMVAFIELPFLHIGWLVFYFTAGYFIVSA